MYDIEKFIKIIDLLLEKEDIFIGYNSNRVDFETYTIFYDRGELQIHISKNLIKLERAKRIIENIDIEDKDLINILNKVRNVFVSQNSKIFNHTLDNIVDKYLKQEFRKLKIKKILQ